MTNILIGIGVIVTIFWILARLAKKGKRMREAREKAAGYGPLFITDKATGKTTIHRLIDGVPEKKGYNSIEEYEKENLKPGEKGLFVDRTYKPKRDN